MYHEIIPSVKLANSPEGYRIPQEGFGVAAMESDRMERAILSALESGYRFFDNAPQYGNEGAVGTILKKSGYSREECFISTKLEGYCHAYPDAIAACESSLQSMGLDYLDMYLILWPLPHLDQYCEAWRALETLHQQGKVRIIGVSNFNQSHLEKLMANCTVKPMVNSLEVNPYFTQSALCKYCEEQGIRVVNWFPLGGPLHPLIPYDRKEFKILLEDPLLRQIGQAHEKTSAQVILRWAVEHGMTPIPKSSKPQRILENREIFDFRLTQEEITQIDQLDHGRRLGPDPDTFQDTFRPA
jgi:diketogulonate reductase-like aldo/keto reductase